jgi:cholesterol transport system auxiliary component
MSARAISERSRTPGTPARSRPSRRSFARLAAIAALSATLSSGCTGSLLDSDLPQNTQYVLTAAPGPGSGATPTQADVSIGRPEVAPGLDTSRIAVLKGQALDYFRAATWGGTTADVVQALLVGSFEQQRLFRSVTAEQSRVTGQYAIDFEVRDFQAEYGAGDAPTVHVRIVARLIRVIDRKLIETLTAQARSPATDNRMSIVAAAFQTASQQVAAQLAQEVAAAIARDVSPARSADTNR